MRAVGQVRVLMLGWEYPPRFAGGLGKACQGLSNAMAKLGAQVFFVLPTFPERVVEPRLEVVGALECLAEAGWEVDLAGRISVSPNIVAAESDLKSAEYSFLGEVKTIRTDAELSPYSRPHSDKIPFRLKSVLERMASTEPSDVGQEKKTFKLGLKKTLNQTPRQTDPPAPAADSSQSKAGGQEIYGKNLWAEIERFCFTVRHLAETHEVDVVHAHDWMTFPAAFEYQRMTGVPVYLHVHATEYDRSGDHLNHDVFRIERDGFRRANHIFAVSKYTAGIIERLYGINRRKISVVYNAPEESMGSSTPLASTHERKQQVVFLGRLTFQKGPDHFLRASALVQQANPQARFILCGTGDMLDKLRAQTHKLRIEEKVHFAGFVDPAGVDQILQSSKVLVMPSVSEPFGLVALEAIRCGIPVILSKQSGVREVLHRALQVDFWDHEKLADQILAALRLSDLSQQLVEDGLDQMQRLSWERSAQQVIDYYKHSLGSTFAQSIGGAHGH